LNADRHIEKTGGNRKSPKMFKGSRQCGMRRLLSKVAERLSDSGAFLPWKECQGQ
jgi:hypothetical protein